MMKNDNQITHKVVTFKNVSDKFQFSLFVQIYMNSLLQ